MFGKTQPERNENFTTIIDPKVSIEGNVVSASPILMSGKLNGDMHCEGDVFVGSEGFLSGNIYAENVYVAGIVEGSIETEGFLKILGTGKLYGNIIVRRLIAEEGAVFEGKCSMTDMSVSPMDQPEMNVKRSKSDNLFRKNKYNEDNPSLLQQIDGASDME